MRQHGKPVKVGIITSRGGHLWQLYRLLPVIRRYDRFWVAIPGEDTSSILRGERVYAAFGPETRNIANAFRNLLLAWKVLRYERPDVLISCGAGVAPPFFYIGKLLGMRLIFIEPYDLIRYPTLSARMIQPIVDTLFVQHPTQLIHLPRARYSGSVI